MRAAIINLAARVRASERSMDRVDGGPTLAKITERAEILNNHSRVFGKACANTDLDYYD